jgi:anti-sigma regulatory factor (Ser/Thr protein kinase)
MTQVTDEQRGSTMPLIPTPGASIALTAQDIDDWPEALEARALANCLIEGRPASFSLPPLYRAVQVSRRLTTLWMDAQRIHDEDARFAAVLVVSELMTNAITHTHSTCVTGLLQRRRDHLVVEVRDQGRASSEPFRHRADSTDDHGRGLMLVSECVRRWGVRRGTDGGRTVWAAIPVAEEIPDGEAGQRSAEDSLRTP